MQSNESIHLINFIFVPENEIKGIFLSYHALQIANCIAIKLDLFQQMKQQQKFPRI